MAAKKITPKKHREQIERYTRARPAYQVYAVALQRTLQRACAVSFPGALAQSRAKKVSSFAEKAVRKFDKYQDPLNDFNDLCGARVLVQTAEQVKAVKQFIEANFEILEADEKGLHLGEDRFGYRDMHYIVRLRPEKAGALGIDKPELITIGRRKAEIQVRTWLQHAWADTLHDRIYKNPLRLSREMKRTGNLLAALMEEGDRNYSAMAQEIDGMLANYTSYATREEVGEEIKVQRLILRNEPEPAKRPALALKLGRLHAAGGDFAEVVKELNPYAGAGDENRCELLQDLGFALCQIHRQRPDSGEYRRGLEMMEASKAICNETGCPAVPHPRKRESLHARVLSRLGWALEPLRPRWPDSRRYHQQAIEHEPNNPYYLADMLGFEIFLQREHSLPAATRTTLLEAVRTCRSHAEAGIELPRAYFTAGRLSLLLGRTLDSLGWYARGIRHCLAGIHCFPPDALAIEANWVERLHAGVKAPEEHRWVLDLLALAKRTGPDTGAGPALPPKVIILSGGAATLDRKLARIIRPLVEVILDSFSGTVISGGTTSGVPGCAGRVAAELRGRNLKRFKLIGYIPEKLPFDAKKDTRYDQLVPCGAGGFTPGQVLKSWQDIKNDGVDPRDVICVGFGGGPLSAFEYRAALALGTRVVIAQGSGGAAEAIIADPLWAGVPNLMPIPLDRATFHALLRPGKADLDPDRVEAMAREFHERYVAGSAARLPENMRPWKKLDETFKKANREQARYARVILEACGYKVRAADRPKIRTEFTDQEVERMAEMEHGRWNVERIREGWRYGKPRDDETRIHDCILPWSDSGLDPVRKYDREAVEKFPEILARAGWEVVRPAAKRRGQTGRRRKH
ncbi:MAG: RyR domain-containing protein [Candidatus Erginobacter occultus]|nr:RyR domain-containing protein [Candidatus Erginobacter occultus]